MKKKKPISVFIFLSFLSLSAKAHFFDEQARGWHWYQEQEAPMIEPLKYNLKGDTEKLTATETVNAYKKTLEESLHAAWVNPSFNNIQAYQALQKDMMDRAEAFSDMWMQVVYQVPHLDHTLITPVNHKARHLYLDQKKDQAKERIQELAKGYGLFFFFDSHCPYCLAFSPVVKLFSKLYNWEVIPITADGGSLVEFPRPLANNGIINKWKVDVFPALFAVNPSSEEIIPIVYGMTSLDEIESRILLLTSLRGIK